jgi:hypothetical protein
VWAAHREAANATMVDWSDVLLLRPLRPTTGFPHNPTTRPPVGAVGIPASVIIATIFPADAEVATESGVWFETETAANNFPALPVRTDERVLVSFTSSRRDEELPPQAPGTRRLLLQPTARSLLR